MLHHARILRAVADLAAEAEGDGQAPLCIAVCDAVGDLLHYTRMAGAKRRGTPIAQAKAYTWRAACPCAWRAGLWAAWASAAASPRRTRCWPGGWRPRCWERAVQQQETEIPLHERREDADPGDVPLSIRAGFLAARIKKEPGGVRPPGSFCRMRAYSATAWPSPRGSDAPCSRPSSSQRMAPAWPMISV